MAEIFVLNRFEPNPYVGAVEVDTTSRGSFRDLSPFFLGPIFYQCSHFGQVKCLRFENLWQYCKVYPVHTFLIGNGRYTPEPQIRPEYYEWRNRGFAQNRAVRYPMGKGAKPLFSLWGMQRLSYIEARKKIYIPLYSDLVRSTKSYAMMYNWLVNENRNIVLRDFDGYDFRKMNMSLRDVVNNSKKSMGHAFVIAMLLTGEYYKCLE